MADLIIPTFPSLPSYRQRTVLDGVEYVLDFRFAEREARWYLDLRKSTGELLSGSIKLVSNFELLASRRTNADIPPGELVVLDLRPTPADPGFDELGDVVALIYREAETEAA